MKMTKKLMILPIVLLLTNCTNLDKKENREKERLYLQNKFEVLVSNKIDEKNRMHLENEYIKYQNTLLNVRKKLKAKEDIDNVDAYIKDAEIKIQNLKDLQD